MANRRTKLDRPRFSEILGFKKETNKNKNKMKNQEWLRKTLGTNSGFPPQYTCRGDKQKGRQMRMHTYANIMFPVKYSSQTGSNSN